MTLKQLEYFCAVAQAENISLAARQLYVAQPALSRQISLLEDELGVQLFLRTNRGITLTEAGERLFHQSQDLFSDIRRLKDEIRGTENGMRGQINIGALYSNMPLLNRKLRIFRRLFPDIHIYVRTGSPDDLLVDLRQHKLHLLLLRMGGNDLSEFNVKILREDPLEIITSRELDPAPDMDEIPVELLRGIPMCMLRSEDAWGYNHSLVDFCQKNGFDLNIICQCYDSPMVMQLVQAGIGLSFQPRSIADTLQNPNVYAKPIRDFSVGSYPCLVWHPGNYVSGCLKRFLPLFETDYLPEEPS